MLMRSFTKREKGILLLLVVFLLAGLYFMVIHYPVTNRLEEIEERMLQVEDNTNLALVKAQEYNRMKKEMEEIFALPPEKVTVMPAYPNQSQLLYHYNMIFADLNPDIRMSEAKIEGNIASRNVSFSVTVGGFEEAKDFVGKLTGTGYRCLLQNLTVSPEEGDMERDAMTLSGNIVFYELVTNNG